MLILMKSKEAKDDFCYISKKLFETLKLKEYTQYSLNFGESSYNTYIKKSKLDDPTFFLSKSIANQINFPNNLLLNLIISGNKLCLGPIIGVFINPRYLARIKKNTPYLTTYYTMKAGQKANYLLCFFSYMNVDLEKRLINSYIYHDENWEQLIIPFPKIIYDQGYGFKKEEKEQVKKVRETLGLDSKFINSRNYLGKMELYNKLSKYKEIENYLPETIRYQNFEDVVEMLNKYNFVFLKSFYGNRGEGVISIQPISQEYFKVIHYKKKLEIKGINNLKIALENITNGNKFIIQQGIKLLKYKGNYIDNRILVQRNKDGEWQVSKIFTNIAEEDHTITNITIGRWKFYENIYHELKDADENLISYNQLSDIALKITNYIEESFGPFGELGLDLGIDEKGKVWFFEANTMPDKYLSNKDESENDIIPRFLPVIEYAKYLIEGDYSE